MEKQAFSIVMQTSIGKRYGTMTVEWKEECISGFLTILEHTEAFHGCVDESGNCRIEGKIISLTRTIPYIATGKINTTMIQLILKGEKNVFALSGVPDIENGGSNL